MHCLMALKQNLVTAKQEISNIIKSNINGNNYLTVEQQEMITTHFYAIHEECSRLIAAKDVSMQAKNTAIGASRDLLTHMMACSLDNKELALNKIEKCFNKIELSQPMEVFPLHVKMELSPNKIHVKMELSPNKRKQESLLEDNYMTKKLKAEEPSHPFIQMINDDHSLLTSFGLSFETMKAYLEKHGSKLSFLGLEGLTSAQALELMALCPNLEHLLMLGCKLNDESVDRIQAQNYKLVSLSLTHNEIGDRGAETIARYFKDTLQILDLTSSNVGDKGAVAIAKNLKLHRLDLALTNISNEGVIVLAENLKETLRILCLESTRINTIGILAIAENLKFLQQFKLIGSRVSDEGAKAMAKGLKFLRVLKLFDAQIGSEGIKALAEGLPWLQKLNLNQNDVTEKDVEVLAMHSRFLHELRLQGSKVHVKGIKAIAKGLPLLEKLNLSSDDKSIDDIRTIARNLSFLKVLKLRNCGIDETRVFALINNLNFLQSLALDSDGEGIERQYKQCKIFVDWDELLQVPCMNKSRSLHAG